LSADGEMISMGKKTKDKKAKRERVSAKKWSDDNKGGLRLTAFRVPDKTQLFQLKENGIKRVDVIPFKAGKDNPQADEGVLHFERTVYMHRRIGPSGDDYCCPARCTEHLEPSERKSCPVCEEHTKLKSQYSDPTDKQKKLLQGLKAKRRQLILIYDHDDDERGVQLWHTAFYKSFGQTLQEAIEFADPDEEHKIFFADPEDGSTLKLGIGKEQFEGRDFYPVKTVEFKKRKKPLSEKLLKKAPCLDELLIILDYDDLEAIFKQTGAGDGKKKKEGKKKDKGDKPSSNASSTSEPKKKKKKDKKYDEVPF